MKARRFGLPRMLEAMLGLRHPGTRFEVVNAAMVAINSNVILPIARDCAGAGADIWIIYMGNNEVVGPFGAGTVFGPQVPPVPLIRASLGLKTARAGQLIDTLCSVVRKPPREKSEWGGMEMFLDQQVRADDRRMSAVYDHFSRNLSDIVKTGRKCGASVVVSTVAVNLRKCAPFGSEHRRGLTEADRNKWEHFYQNGVAATSAGDTPAAARWFDEAAQIDDQFAELRFRQGGCALALGNTGDAQKQLLAARDLDTLRFRCDSRLNDLIRRTVSAFNDQAVVLADAETEFARQSPEGLPGDDWFYEHVHLTFEGNYLLARTLAAKLEPLLPAAVTDAVAANQPWPSVADCARRLAWSDWDKQKALADIYSRLSGPPFVGQINHDTQVQNLRSSLERLIPATRPSGVNAAKTSCEAALAEAPDDPGLREQLAELDELTGELAEAETNAQRAVDLLPGGSSDWSELGVILAKEKKYESAARAFRHAFRLDSQDAWALQDLAQALKDLGRNDEAIHEYRHALAVKPRFGLAWLGLGQIYEQIGRQPVAEECFQKALQNRIDRAPELTALARFCENRGWREAAATNFDEALKLNPFEAAVLLDAAQNLSALGRHAEAEHRYAQATELSPDSVPAHFFFGLELGRDHKPAEAVREFREAVRIMPDMTEARFNLGISLVDAGNYPEALVEFKNVLEKDPANAKALQYAQALRQKLSGSQPP
jgi:tetratricopeptide (TPR) repeat protein